MGRINVKKAIENGRKLIKDGYDMTMNDANEIRSMSNGDWDKISNSFNFGYMQGYKAAMKEVERKQKGAA